MSARVWVAVPTAITPGSEGVELPRPSSVGDRIRATLNRLSHQVDPEVREALNQIGEAITDLEHRVDRVQHRIALGELGLELRRELVEIAETGLALQRSLPYPEGTDVVVYLDITVWGSSTLLTLPGHIRTRHPEARIDFVGISQDLRDTLVAFVFQEQGRAIRSNQAR